jgi:uncharacterized membrane protein
MTTQLTLETSRNSRLDQPSIINQLPLYLALIPLLLLTYQNLFVPLWHFPSFPLADIGVAMFVALFSLLHNLYTFGWRRTLALLGITLVVAWGFEQTSVITGLPYGVYHYSDALGAKLGHVPYAIPLAWYSMLYPSYVLARLITGDTQPHRQPTWGALLWRAFVSGIVITAWDVLVDPMASAPGVHSWVWEQGGAYYGVPNVNFVGWVLTGFTAILLYSLFEQRFPARPLGAWTRPVLLLPLVVYGLTMLQLMLRSDAPSEWPVLAAFVMGFPLVAALSQLRTKIA